MDTDKLTEEAYETIRIARQASAALGAGLAVSGSKARHEDEFLNLMLDEIESFIEDPREGAEWLDHELSAAELKKLCVRLKAHIQATLRKPVRERGEPSISELAYLQGLGTFDNLALLKMWAETTPRTIFPNRKIGALSEGYEASFLALEDNPDEELKNVRKIRLRFKRGFALEP